MTDTKSTPDFDSVEFITSNNILVNKQRQAREESRIHQFKMVDEASNYAGKGLQTLVLLNAGALSLIPTFLKAFSIKEINGEILFCGLLAFSSSLAFCLLIYLFAYCSNAMGAWAEQYKAIAEQNKLATQHYIERKWPPLNGWLTDEKKYEEKSNRRLAYAHICEFVAIFFFVAATFSFLYGSYKTISSVVPIAFHSEEIARDK